MKRRRLLLWILLLEVCLFILIRQTETALERSSGLSASVGPALSFQTLKDWGFAGPESLKGWDEKVFHGRTRYTVTGDGSEGFLEAASDKTSSALYYETSVDLSARPFLNWEWRALQFPLKKALKGLTAKDENDFAARVYAVFPGFTLFSSDVIQYVWDDRYPENTFAASPYSDNVKVMVVQSGLPPEGQPWVPESRDLVKDYERLFGHAPKKRLGAIAIMSDSDNTASSSKALFRRIQIQKSVPTPKETQP